MRLNPLFLSLFHLYNLLPLCYHYSMNEIQVNIRMERELKARIEGIAKKEKRSVNNMINVILAEYVEKAEKRK